MRGVFAITALVALLVVACGDGDGGSTPVSGIEGRVLYDPPCGQEGTLCPATGVSALFITPVGEAVMIPGHTNSSGEFQVPLAPGDYDLSVQPEAEEGVLEAEPSDTLRVSVSVGELTPVDIIYAR